MKWFKHNSDANQSLKLRALINSYGMRGYGLWWICCEICAREGKSMDSWCISSVKQWSNEVQHMSGEDKRFTKRVLKKMAQLTLIDEKSLKQGGLCMPQMSEYCDDYTDRVRRVSEHSPDNVPLEKKREDKIRLDKKRVDNISSFSKGFFYDGLPIRVSQGKLWVAGQKPWKEFDGSTDDLTNKP